MQNNYEDRFTYADQSMLDMLQQPLLYGDRVDTLAARMRTLSAKR